MKQLWIHKKTSKYFCVVPPHENNPTCDRCYKTFDIGDTFLLHRQVFVKQMNEFVYCYTCVKESKSRDYSEYFAVILPEIVPSNCKLVSNAPVQLVESRATTASAVHETEGIHSDTSQVRVVDRTVLAGRPEASNHGLKIGKRSLKEIEMDDKKEMSGYA